jgi:hypothetical protein
MWASWNGATEVEAWDVFLGDDEQNLRHASRVARHGFETEIRVRYTYGRRRYALVKVIGDASGQSAVVRVGKCP